MKPYIKNIAILAFGAFIMAVGYSVFLIPNEIIPAGFTGLAMIINRLLAKINVGIPVGMIVLMLNIPLYLFSMYALGLKFGIKSIMGVIFYSVFIDIISICMPYLNMKYSEYDKLLYSIFGGVTVGLGLGLVIRAGGSTGGSDMISLIISQKRPQVALGVSMFAVNFAVIVLSLLVQDVMSILHTVIVIFVYSKSTDIISDELTSSRTFYIISEKPQEVLDVLGNKLGYSAMLVNGISPSMAEKKIVACICLRVRVTEMRKAVIAIDKNAVIYSIHGKAISGIIKN